MSGELHLRVRVQEAWDDILIDVPPTTTIAAVKEEALALARVTAAEGAFLVKFRGAELSDESLSLADANVPDEAALIVLRRRRVPVR